MPVTPGWSGCTGVGRFAALLKENTHITIRRLVAVEVGSYPLKDRYSPKAQHSAGCCSEPVTFRAKEIDESVNSGNDVPVNQSVRLR